MNSILGANFQILGEHRLLWLQTRLERVETAKKRFATFYSQYLRYGGIYDLGYYWVDHYWEVAYGLSFDTNVDDLGWPWTTV